jgi:hypothetical protein
MDKGRKRVESESKRLIKTRIRRIEKYLAKIKYIDPPLYAKCVKQFEKFLAIKKLNETELNRRLTREALRSQANYLFRKSRDSSPVYDNGGAGNAKGTRDSNVVPHLRDYTVLNSDGCITKDFQLPIEGRSSEGDKTS